MYCIFYSLDEKVKGEIVMKKKIFTFFICMTMCLLFSITSFAAEGSEIYFDLLEPTAQEHSFVTESGEQVTVGCEMVPISTYSVSKPLQAGSIVHVWLTGPVSCEFYMDVSPDYKITDAYDETYTAIGVTVTSDVLTYSSTSAKYTLKFQTPIQAVLSGSGYLKAAISGTNLVLSETIYGLNNFS